MGKSAFAPENNALHSHGAFVCIQFGQIAFSRLEYPDNM